MSEKLAVVRRWIELYNERGDEAEFIALLDPEVELQTPGGPRLHGHGQVRAWFEKAPENVRSRIVADRFIEAGDVVVGLGSIEVRWIESGELAYRSESAAVYRFRDAKIVGWQPFESHRAALEAAGLPAEEAP
jgi:ketosteroid isomerase-like protein